MKPLKIGLVLSGGGAKGAYQIGLFRALRQLGAMNELTAISGCSIGAINALLLAGGGEPQWTEAWGSLTYEGFLRREPGLPELPTAEDGSSSIKDLVSRIHTKAAEAKTLGELLARSDLSPFSQAGLRQLMDVFVDFSVLERVPPYLWVCAYNMEREEPEYFALSGLSKEDAADLVMASSSIPLVFPPVEYRGSHYCDGGIVPPYSAKKNGDKIPLKPLRGAGCSLVIICYLSHYDKLELTGFPAGTQFLELYPSRPLELIPGAGTLNLAKDTLAENQELGLNDALAALAPYLLEQARGGSGEKALENHRQYNIQLLGQQLSLLKKAESKLKERDLKLER